MRGTTARSTCMALALLVAPASVSGQAVHWERHGPATQPPVTVFHSPQAADLPTAATIGKGEWQVEISHRFLPPFSDGPSALWGLDGPIYNRLGLAYAPSRRSMLHIVRSNLADNFEVGGKIRFLEGGRTSIPFQAAVAAGFAWNTAVHASNGVGYSDHESQAYAQLVLNALLGGRVAVGVVPSLLHNPRLADTDTPTELTVGVNGALYMNKYLSLIAEWNASPAHPGMEHDPVAFGLQIETGGHFFKLIATNSARPNPTQFLGGTPYAFTPHEWRFGFNVTRLLAF